MHYLNKLFLASASPRRRILISQVFENTELLQYSCDEPSWQKGQKPEQYLVLCLDAKWDAALKAPAFHSAKDGEGLLVADTIVVLNGKVLGKPLNAADASSMLRELSTSVHEVWTGFRLGRLEKEKVNFINRICKSKVEFRALSPAEIKSYVRSKEPMDKAGAYGFQGIGIHLVKSVRGSYTNIVGLPLIELKSLARELSFEVRPS